MKSKKILGIAALAAVTAVGGSFAYFNQTLQAVNPFNTGSYDTTMQETFNPADGENWQPGTTVGKEVKVANTGNQPVVVRARFDETWTRRGVTGDNASKTITAEEAAMSGNGKKITTNATADQLSDGNWDNDDTVVRKNLATPSQWILGADGWYYYIGTLAGGATTEALLESVTLSADLDLGTEDRAYTYTAVINGETTTDDVPGDYIADGKVKLKELSDYLGLKKGDTLTTDVKIGTVAGTGYSNADYVLTITTQTVQATSAAVDDAFKGTSASWEEAVGAANATALGWDLTTEESSTEESSTEE